MCFLGEEERFLGCQVFVGSRMVLLWTEKKICWNNMDANGRFSISSNGMNSCPINKFSGF